VKTLREPADDALTAADKAALEALKRYEQGLKVLKK